MAVWMYMEQRKPNAYVYLAKESTYLKNIHNLGFLFIPAFYFFCLYHAYAKQKHLTEAPPKDCKFTCNIAGTYIGMFILGIVSYVLQFVYHSAVKKIGWHTYQLYGLDAYQDLALTSVILSAIFAILVNVFPKFVPCCSWMPKTMFVDKMLNGLLYFVAVVSLGGLTGGSTAMNMAGSLTTGMEKELVEMIQNLVSMFGYVLLLISICMVFALFFDAVMRNQDYELPVAAFILLPGAAAFVHMICEDQLMGNDLEKLPIIIELYNYRTLSLEGNYVFSLALVVVVGVLTMAGILLFRIFADKAIAKAQVSQSYMQPIG